MFVLQRALLAAINGCFTWVSQVCYPLGSHEFEITENRKIIDLTGKESSAYNQIIRGGVKIDLETKDMKPQGGATLVPHWRP